MRWSRLLGVVLSVSLLAVGCSDDTSSAANSANNANASNASNNTNSANSANGTNNTNSANACSAETDAELCTAASATCGAITVEDRCGDERTVMCGMCAEPDSCVENACECVETDQAFCARLMKDCGTVVGTDLCGEARTVECGACDSGEACGADNVCECPCEIDGQCVPDGAVNPENPCEVCAPDASLDAWTTLAAGSSCDDGLACTENTTCDAAGECVGALMADTCLINGACHADGDADPGSACRVCDSDADTAAWSNLAVGTSCDDGLACSSGEACDANGECSSDQITAGTCAIDDACWDQGIANPDNPCEVCNPANDQTGWSDAAAGTACDDGLACTSNTTCNGGGECLGTVMTGTCAIDGVCYNQDDANPDAVCEVCDATNLQTDWSPSANGAACDDGLACTVNDVCAAGECQGTLDANSCLIRGECYADGEASPTGRECVYCDASANQADWSKYPSGTACDDGLDCTGDGTCNPGGNCREGTAMAGTCAIGGACYSDGDVNPMNPCESCQSTLNNSAWSPRAGEVCDDGLSCTSGEVCTNDGVCEGTLDATSCLIDGSCYADTTLNPSNSCEFCDVDVDQLVWSDVMSGTMCDDGLSCTSGATCDAGVCGGATLDSGSCVIDDACFADDDPNPANVCQVCASGTDTAAWTDVADRTACGPAGANLCCGGTCQDVAVCP